MNVSCARALDEWGIVVDNFRYTKVPADSHFFLTHFHNDHTEGLDPEWDHGTIHVSHTTLQLIKHRWGATSPITKHLKAWRPLRWCHVTIRGQHVEVACVEAGHCAGSLMWLFVLPNGSTAVFTGDYRPHSNPLDWSGWSKVKPVSLLFYDTSFHNPQVVLPSVSQSVRALNRVYQQCGAHQTFAVVCHTGGTEQLVGLWCRKYKQTWYVDESCKHRKETHLGLQELAGHLEAKSAHAADVVCVGNTFRRGREDYVLVKPSAIWFLCHANELHRDKERSLGNPVEDTQGTWRVHYSTHPSYQENMALIRALKPQMVSQCVKQIVPSQCVHRGSVRPTTQRKDI